MVSGNIEISSSPLVSVIMNCLNGSKYLREALDSIYAQTYSNWEIIFWDNASSDNSGSIAKSYGKKVKYFCSETTSSLGTARNNALACCKGKYIGFLDTDDLWMPEKLERQVQLMEQKPNIALVCCNSLIFNDKSEQHSIFQISRPSRGKVFNELLSHNFMHTISMLYRKDILDRMPYAYDDDFTINPDWDLSLRVAYNYEVDYDDAILTKWRNHSDSESNRRRFRAVQEWLILRNRLVKNFPDIENKYADAIKIFDEMISYELALKNWSEGHLKTARIYMLENIFQPKNLAAYICSWFFSYEKFEKYKVFIMKIFRKYGRK